MNDWVELVMKKLSVNEINKYLVESEKVWKILIEDYNPKFMLVRNRQSENYLDDDDSQWDEGSENHGDSDQDDDQYEPS